MSAAPAPSIRCEAAAGDGGRVVVSNATLHNEGYVKGVGADGEPIREGRDIRVDDTVTVVRAGDVIPKVMDVDPHQAPGRFKPFEFPDHCPACGSRRCGR